MISVGFMHAKRSIKTVISLSPIGTHIPFYTQCYICGFWNHAKECYMLHCQDRYEGFCWDIAAFICFVLWYYTSFIFLVIRIDTFKTFNFVSWNNTTIWDTPIFAKRNIKNIWVFDIWEIYSQINRTYTQTFLVDNEELYNLIYFLVK